MLETRKDLKNKVAGLETRIAELEGELQESEVQIEAAEGLAQTATTEKDELAKQVVDLELERDELAKQVSEQTSAIEANEETIVELEEEVQVTEEKVAEQAAEQLATIGHEPIEDATGDDSNGTLPAEEYDRQYNAIEDSVERAKWHLANRHRRGN